MLFAAGVLLSLVGWLWTVIRGFEVGLICALLNFFFPPLPQFIYCIYEKGLRQPTLLMVLGWVLSAYGGWHQIHGFMQHQVNSLGHGIAV